MTYKRRKEAQERRGKEDNFLDTERDIVITGSTQLKFKYGAEKLVYEMYPQIANKAREYMVKYRPIAQSCIGTCIPIQVSKKQCVFILINRLYEDDVYEKNSYILAYLTAALKDLHRVLNYSKLEHRKLCLPRLGSGPQRIPWRFTWHMIDTYLLKNFIDCEIFTLDYRYRIKNHLHFP